jgi:hypothetical protein
MNENQIYSIKNAIKSEDYCFLESFIDPAKLPGWSELISSLNNSAHTKADFHVNDPFVETQVNHAIRRGIGYFYSFFDSSDVHVQPFLDPIIEEFEENGLTFIGTSVFMNLFTEDDYAKVHRDEEGSSIYIQCEGTATWRFHKDSEGGPDSIIEGYVLNPGDAVFFTEHAYHSVTTDTPRASIVLRMPPKTQ